MGHPAVAKCAVIAMPHPQVGRAPAAGGRAEGRRAPTLGRDARRCCREHFAKWWLPDDVVFVEALPQTATGKVSKLTLRQQFADHQLPEAATG